MTHIADLFDQFSSDGVAFVGSDRAMIWTSLHEKGYMKCRWRRVRISRAKTSPSDPIKKHVSKFVI